jgi:antibiotic biosynthesis monooxygenase (ABM) superfamily enzyme
MNELLTPPTLSLSPATEPQPPPIGGWLIVVAVGLGISVLQNLNNLLRIQRLLGGSIWPRLTNPASPVYHPYWRVVIIYEFVAACLYVVANFVAIILFFGKRRAFPIFAVVLIPTLLVLGFIDHYLVGLIPAMAESSAHTRGAYLLAAKFITLHLWIPYFLISKRVKTTFVR